MNRIGKYEKFPVLQPGDVVVCGGHTADIVTHGGGYKVRESTLSAACIELVGYSNNLERVFSDCDSSWCDPQYRPEAVFRPAKGLSIPVDFISNMIADWRSVGWRAVNAANMEEFRRIWSIDDDNAKELTVDEVSKLLGYKVKIVGSDSAD